MVRVALDVVADSRWSKSTTVRLALELEPINLEPCIVKVPVWIPCWSVARPTRWCGCDLVGWVIRFSYDLILN